MSFDRLAPHYSWMERVLAGRELHKCRTAFLETTRGARSFAQLPANAVKYVKRLEELVECPVALLSTSPDREDTILVRDPFVD